jgi:hypothetical protein
VTENRDEKLYGSRNPVLLEGESPTSRPERPNDQPDAPSLPTADLASAGEQRALEETHKSAKVPNVGIPPAGGTGKAEQQSTPLFSPDEAAQFRSRWDGIQVGFVDEPRRAVEQADELVASTVKRLAQIFADERTKLEQQWSRGDQVSTEDLRVALQRYRSFFSRLLSV